MDISLSQIPKVVGAGPLIVYMPETVGDETTVTEEDQELSPQAKSIIDMAAKAKVSTLVADRLQVRAQARLKAGKPLKATGISGLNLAALGIWNPFAAISNAVGLDKVVTWVAEKTGMTDYAYIPTEQEIKNTQSNVTQLQTNIARNEAAGQTVQPSDKAALEIGKQAVADMQAAREKVLDPYGSFLSLLKKIKTLLVVAGIGVVGMVGYGLYRRAKGR